MQVAATKRADLSEPLGNPLAFIDQQQNFGKSFYKPGQEKGVWSVVLFIIFHSFLQKISCNKSSGHMYCQMSLTLSF